MGQGSVRVGGAVGSRAMMALGNHTGGILAGRGCRWRRVLRGFQTQKVFHVTGAERCGRICVCSVWVFVAVHSHRLGSGKGIGPS